ncbi:hypothetical protein LCGC14_1923440 [marine sediment metagenome]|uniref:Uncharacterized protein n=1 Tax=marine sediment metagenome TaxID=412755 RepID=A0A0F9I404_9ZZZZ
MEKKLFSKFFIILASIVIVSGGVLAFFIYSYDKSVDYEIIGGKGNLVVVLDLTNQILNVSENLSSTQSFTILNQNGFANFTYLFNSNVTGVELGCDPTGDISFTLLKSNEILNGTNFTMTPSFNDFNFTVNAINNRVCPQNITATLNFSEV